MVNDPIWFMTNNGNTVVRNYSDIEHTTRFTRGDHYELLNEVNLW